MEVSLAGEGIRDLSPIAIDAPGSAPALLSFVLVTTLVSHSRQGSG